MKVQYDLEGGVLKQSMGPKSVSKQILYGVLLLVIVAGWVVYQQGGVLRSKELSCQTISGVTVTTEDLTNTVVQSTENPGVTEQFHVESVDNLIGALFSPFVESESAVVEMKLDTDGFLIKFGENVDNLVELARDSEINTMMAMALQELLLLGQEDKPGKKVDIGLMKKENSYEATTVKKVEELWTWSTGNLLEFKFRFEDNHWELEGAAEYKSSEEKNSNERSEESTDDR
ncbi:AAEL012858-PA [Aedes aegypti]|uniref:AAEL012858-PA n=1 Tax=Aedes aegypti TaxID=7159 RepID=Q16KW0_AEDAE|nr:AAEL012858-PA [Aedes aegypti]